MRRRTPTGGGLTHSPRAPLMDPARRDSCPRRRSWHGENEGWLAAIPKPDAANASSARVRFEKALPLPEMRRTNRMELLGRSNRLGNGSQCSKDYRTHRMAPLMVVAPGLRTGRQLSGVRGGEITHLQDCPGSESGETLLGGRIGGCHEPSTSPRTGESRQGRKYVVKGSASAGPHRRRPAGCLRRDGRCHLDCRWSVGGRGGSGPLGRHNWRRPGHRRSPRRTVHRPEFTFPNRPCGKHLLLHCRRWSQRARALAVGWHQKGHSSRQSDQPRCRRRRAAGTDRRGRRLVLHGG